MALRHRLIFSIIIGLVTGVWCGAYLAGTNKQAGDLTWVLSGARLLLAGENPYTADLGQLPYFPQDPLFYPLPALLVVMPLVWLPDVIAGAVFFGVSSALLAYGVATYRPHAWPIFLSPVFLFAGYGVQWSPLLVAAALLPALLPLTIVKPNLGLCTALVAIERGAWKGAAVCAVAIMGLSLIILPSWPLDWFHNIGATVNQSMVTIWPGIFLLLALTRPTDPRARLLLLVALVPFRASYDPLILWLIPQTQRESLLLSITGWIAVLVYVMAGWSPSIYLPWVVAGVALPALALVLVPPLYSRLSRSSARVETPSPLQ